MREIKFRAWDMNCMLGPQGMLMSDTPEWISNLTSEAILLQFTGLLDRLGKEIYEGDIVIWLGYEVRGGKQVRPERLFTVTSDISELFRLSNIVAAGCHEPEVIGNIYEMERKIKYEI